MSDPQPSAPATSSDELFAEFAEGLSLLVRRDIELLTAERGPQLRRVAVELAATVTVALALLLACVAASAAAVAGLAQAMPWWGAALVVAAAWAACAGLLLLLDHPRRLIGRLTEETARGAVERARGERLQAAEALRATAGQLTAAVGREAALRELHAPLDDAEKLIGVAEQGGDDLLKELLVALLAPGRAGLSALELMLGGRRARAEQPPPEPGSAPRRRRG